MGDAVVFNQSILHTDILGVDESMQGCCTFVNLLPA